MFLTPSGSCTTRYFSRIAALVRRDFLTFSGIARARSALHPCQPHGKQTRSRAPAQHPSQPKWSAHPLARACSALYPCQPSGTHTRSRAPAQHGIHASQMVRTASKTSVFCAGLWETMFSGASQSAVQTRFQRVARTPFNSYRYFAEICKYIYIYTHR